jgi:hypothetical protein
MSARQPTTHNQYSFTRYLSAAQIDLPPVAEAILGII